MFQHNQAKVSKKLTFAINIWVNVIRPNIYPKYTQMNLVHTFVDIFMSTTKTISKCLYIALHCRVRPKKLSNMKVKNCQFCLLSIVFVTKISWSRISKANFFVLIWTKNPTNFFLISALASKKRSDQKNKGTLYP